MRLGTHPFTHGLHDPGAGNWAWIQPDGGWGWSNAGLVVDGEESMVALMAAAPDMGVTGEFFTHRFTAFTFAGIDRPPPTVTFDGRLQRTVGDTLVELVEVGPAHTGGDVLVHVPERSTVYTGDILFVEGHPILWAGSIPDVLAAIDRWSDWGELFAAMAELWADQRTDG